MQKISAYQLLLGFQQDEDGRSGEGMMYQLLGMMFQHGSDWVGLITSDEIAGSLHTGCQ